MATNGYMDVARPGLLNGLQEFIESKIAAVAIPFGSPVFVKNGNANEVFLADDTDATRRFFGVAVASHRSFVSGSGEYPIDDQVNVLTRGQIWVKVKAGETGLANKPAYIIDLAADADANKFTAVTTDNLDSGGFFRDGPYVFTFDGASVTLAVVEVRGPK